MKQYSNDFLPVGWHSGYCSLTVLLGILNYFFGTNFAAKDNFDGFWLAKRGRRGKWELLSANEIALFLERLYLDVTNFSGRSKEDAENYKKIDDTAKIELIKKYIHPSFHHHINWIQRIFEDGKTMDLIDPLVEERLASSWVQFAYGSTREELLQTIKQHQQLENGGVLFLLGVSRNILYWYEDVSNGGDGHHVLSTGINSDGNFIIYEPIYPRPNPHYVPTDRVLDAMFALWSHEMLMIKDNPKHY
jgi:hypothetical protein